MKFKPTIAENVAESRKKMDKDILPKEEATKSVVKPEEIDVSDAQAERQIKKAKESKDAEAVIAVNLRLEPHSNAEVLCVLYPGVRVKVNDSEKPDWYALTYQGREVYVMKKYITVKGW